jgi:hypothetical protein
MVRKIVLALVLAAPAAGCHHEPKPHHPVEGELPPLPPASGTAVGYLVDASGELKLSDEQLGKLKDIDASLAARQAGIDVQLRQIERPTEEEQEAPPKPGERGHHRARNNAPGANTMTNADAAKLHDMHRANDRDALKRAFALLDDTQKKTAVRILEERGVEAPGAVQKQAPDTSDEGTPLPGMEP